MLTSQHILAATPQLAELSAQVRTCVPGKRGMWLRSVVWQELVVHYSSVEVAVVAWRGSALPQQLCSAPSCLCCIAYGLVILEVSLRGNLGRDMPIHYVFHHLLAGFLICLCLMSLQQYHPVPVLLCQHDIYPKSR